MQRKRNKDEIKFFYRGTNLPNDLIITSVKLKGEIKNKDIIEKKQTELIEKKNYLNQVKLKLVVALLKILAKIKKLGS